MSINLSGIKLEIVITAASVTPITIRPEHFKRIAGEVIEGKKLILD